MIVIASIGGYITFLLLLLLVLFQVLIEASIMYFVNFQTMNKSFLQAFVANLISMAAILGLLYPIRQMVGRGNGAEIISLLSFFTITIILEGVIIYLFNRTKPIWSTIKTVLIINITTFFIYYLIFLATVR